MEQESRFGLDLGQLGVMKKRVGADYKQLLRVFFFVFSWAKKMLYFFLKKRCSVITKKLHKMRLEF